MMINEFLLEKVDRGPNSSKRKQSRKIYRNKNGQFVSSSRESNSTMTVNNFKHMITI